MEEQRRFWTIYDTEDSVERTFTTLEEYKELIKQEKVKRQALSWDEDLFKM